MDRLPTAESREPPSRFVLVRRVNVRVNQQRDRVTDMHMANWYC